MNHICKARWLLITGVLCALQAVAQVPESEDSRAEAAQDTNQTQAASSTEPPTSQSGTTNPSPDTPPSAAAILDYEASEQVSEDLSVAFPVDI